MTITLAQRTTPFDIAAHLETDEDIQAFLKEVNDTSDFIHALNVAARAKGMQND